MTECLQTKSAKQVADLLISDVTYHESIKDYLIQHIGSDELSVHYWMVLFGLHLNMDVEDMAPVIAECFMADLEGFRAFIKIVLVNYLMINRPTFMYWVLWFAGFDSADIETCENALIKKSAVPIVALETSA